MVVKIKMLSYRRIYFLKSSFPSTMLMVTINPRAFLSCNKEPLRGHDSTQDLAASIEAEALVAKVDDIAIIAIIGMIIVIVVVFIIIINDCRLVVERRDEGAAQGQELLLLILSTPGG